jgi:hypothetical protein
VPSVPACLCRRTSLFLLLMCLAICCLPALAQSAPGAASSGGNAGLNGSGDSALSGPGNSALSGAGNPARSGLGNSALSGLSYYDPRLTFAPLTLPDSVNAYRSSNGAPGPAYWQNEADYELHATLDTANKQLRATETITYTNNSPDALPSLWVQLEQNIYREDSRAHVVSAGSPHPRQHKDAAASDTNAAPEKTTTEGFVFDSVAIEQGKQTTKAEYLVSDTRMQIRLPEPLKAHGQLKIHIEYHYRITGEWGGRTSWGMSKQGEIYDIAQWYPRMCVYDDLRGWDTLPYLGSEFYWSTGTSIIR